MSITVTKDSMAAVLRQMQELAGKRVMIGVTSNTADREGPINNAGILYVMENGSPEQNIPARPTLVPGVEKALPRAIKLLQKSAKGALDGNHAAVEHGLNAAGLVAEMSVKAEFLSNVPPPLKPSTIRGRKYQRGTKSRRKNESDYLASVKGGMSPGEAQSAAGIVALVNTGELRNSITHVIRKAK